MMTNIIRTAIWFSASCIVLAASNAAGREPDGCYAYSDIPYIDDGIDTRIGNGCKGPDGEIFRRIPGWRDGLNWDDVCLSIGKQCTGTRDHENAKRGKGTCTDPAKDNSRAAWCEDVGAINSQPETGICNNLLKKDGDDGDEQVWRGLKSGCAQVLHSECGSDRISARQNVTFYAGKIVRIPRCSGWNCSCI